MKPELFTEDQIRRAIDLSRLSTDGPYDVLMEMDFFIQTLHAVKRRDDFANKPEMNVKADT